MNAKITTVYLFSFIVYSLANSGKIEFPRTETSNTRETTPPSETTEDGTVHPIIEANALKATIHGVYLTTRNQRQIYGYTGIPYTNRNPKLYRFKILESANPFIRNHFYATTYGDPCPQMDSTASESYIGKEDCLYLNVYTPLENPQLEDPLPVLVYFHGGDFIRGDSSSYLPTNLLDEDVLLVTINYRLGALSFFTTGTTCAVGNLALHDQRAALDWVQKYISDFGGEPEKVTIFGQGAGAVSVNYHVLSENSNHFSAAIAQSGSALDATALDLNPLVTSFNVAKMVPACQEVINNLEDDISEEDIPSFCECMLKAEEKDLAVAYNKLMSSYNLTSPYPFAAPQVEDISVVQEPIVSERPYDALKNPSISRVPMIIGTVAQEGSIPFGKMFSEYFAPNGLADDEVYVRNEMITDVLKLMGVSDPTKLLSKSLESTYISYDDADDFISYCPGMIDMIGSLFVKAGVSETALQQSFIEEPNYYPTYLYSFEYEGSSSLYDLQFINETFISPCYHGVSTSDDLMYVFPSLTEQTKDEQEVVDKMVKLWALFAKYRSPTPTEDLSWQDLQIDSWRKYKENEPSYMSMRSNFILQDDYVLSWTITGDAEKTVTESTGTNTDEPQFPDGSKFLSSYDELQDERDAYLATMVVFIVLFCVTSSAAVYFFLQTRR